MKILIIVEPDRIDWYHYLKSDTTIEYCLLWHESDIDMPDWLKTDHFFNKIYFWDEFPTPNALLDGIKPDRVVFFEIIDQRQIALLVSANKRGIKTFYLEHGAAGNKETAIQRANEKNYFQKKKVSYLISRFRNGLGRMLKSKVFYYSSAFQVSSIRSWFLYCQLPFKMLFATPNKALANSIFPERVPYRSIVFNRPNFEQFQLYTGISEGKAVFSGVPLFDDYYLETNNEGCHITYIDHPYLEEGLLNWTQDHHRNIARVLFEFAEANKIKVFVKLHPRSDFSLWMRYGLNSPFFEVQQKGDFTNYLLSSKLILAYSSSLVNGFLCAKKNVVLLGWHPTPGIFGVDFSKSGLCHISLNSNELQSRFSYWLANNLAENNKKAHAEFLNEFNYPFDGKARERVIRTITLDEIY